ncbi:MAG: carbonic anhydrase family protein [Cryomorphaceae bacterium]|nr:carbonic anhydrase [Flavobacteriales bacterium]
MKTISKEVQAKITPRQAIELLKNGNLRFLDKRMYDRDLLSQVNQTASGQYPFAVVLSCIDSRVPAEIVFDQGVGDIFSCRVAGNIVNEDVLGSMEFACKLAGSKVIVVLGHTKCGAVKGACDGAEMGNLTALLSKIKPAVDAETSHKTDRNSGNSDFVDKVADINVHHVVAQIQEKSPVLKEMLDSGEIGLLGAMYNVETGKIDMYEDAIVLKDDVVA